MLRARFLHLIMTHAWSGNRTRVGGGVGGVTGERANHYTTAPLLQVIAWYVRGALDLSYSDDGYKLGSWHGRTSLTRSHDNHEALILCIVINSNCQVAKYEGFKTRQLPNDLCRRDGLKMGRRPIPGCDFLRRVQHMQLSVRVRPTTRSYSCDLGRGWAGLGC